MHKPILALLIALASAGVSEAASAGNPFCEGKRLHGENYAVKYRGFRKQLRKDVSSGRARDLVEAAVNAGRSGRAGESELCRWNRFFFMDSVIYFNQVRELGARTRRDRLLMLLARDRLFREWMDSLRHGELTGYTEWERENLRGEALDRFIARGSSVFGLLNGASSLMNKRPDDPVDARVYDLLQAEGPFSAIMPKVALGAIRNEALRVAVGCVRDFLRIDGCPATDLFSAAKACGAAAGVADTEEAAFTILGVLGSQRMYLLREFKAWMEQNMTREEFGTEFGALKAGAEIYFRSESVAYACGHEFLYPNGLGARAESVKAYHFWSVATVARSLVKNGVEPEAAVRAAKKPARKYKNLIQVPGVAYNLLLGRPLTNGTVGDYSDVIEEQDLGARFGAGLIGQE